MYVGDGKGKTTAAIGLAIRAAGAGKNVLFTQFVKAAKASESGEWPPSSELLVLQQLKNIAVKVLGRGFVGILGDRKTHAAHVRAARRGLGFVKKAIAAKKYQVVIADEIISAVELKLLGSDEVADLVALAKDKLDALVLTGHKRIKKLVYLADLVTEMKMIKHPYYQGILAQRGIDY